MVFQVGNQSSINDLQTLVDLYKKNKIQLITTTISSYSSGNFEKTITLPRKTNNTNYEVFYVVCEHIVNMDSLNFATKNKTTTNFTMFIFREGSRVSTNLKIAMLVVEKD